MQGKHGVGTAMKLTLPAVGYHPSEQQTVHEQAQAWKVTWHCWTGCPGELDAAEATERPAITSEVRGE